jgi:hypothetical protein
MRPRRCVRSLRPQRSGRVSPWSPHLSDTLCVPQQLHSRPSDHGGMPLLTGDGSLTPPLASRTDIGDQWCPSFGPGTDVVPAASRLTRRSLAVGRLLLVRTPYRRAVRARSSCRRRPSFCPQTPLSGASTVLPVGGAAVRIADAGLPVGFEASADDGIGAGCPVPVRHSRVLDSRQWPRCAWLHRVGARKAAALATSLRWPDLDATPTCTVIALMFRRW